MTKTITFTSKFLPELKLKVEINKDFYVTANKFLALVKKDPKHNRIIFKNYPLFKDAIILNTLNRLVEDPSSLKEQEILFLQACRLLNDQGSATNTSLEDELVDVLNIINGI